MKAKRLMVIVILSVFASFGAYAGCNRDDSACTCVDPTCRPYVGNECTSRASCCAAFGNIAGTDFSDAADEERGFNPENALFFENYSNVSPATTTIQQHRRSYKGE